MALHENFVQRRFARSVVFRAAVFDMRLVSMEAALKARLKSRADFRAGCGCVVSHMCWIAPEPAISASRAVAPGAILIDGDTFQPGPRSRAAYSPVPLVAIPPRPGWPVGFSALIERVCAPESCASVPRLRPRPLYGYVTAAFFRTKKPSPRHNSARLTVPATCDRASTVNNARVVLVSHTAATRRAHA